MRLFCPQLGPSGGTVVMDRTSSKRHHSLPVRVTDGFWGTLSALGLGKVDLDVQSLLGAARRSTGLERFGDEGFLPALGQLLQSIESEAQLNPFGRIYARTTTLSSLRNRLWANACFEKHAEIRRRRLVAPIVIVGPHRSGTTRLHRMLSADSRLAFLKTWEGFNPAPRMGLNDLGRRARRQEVRKALALVPYLYPGVFAGHPMDADWPEEEMLLLNHSFCSFFAFGVYNAPSYYRWFLECDKTAAYQYTADLMKLIAWARGEPEGKRWVLKNPQHMLDLDVLVRTFPDARLVFIHRDPRKTVGSVMSLMWHYAVQHTDEPRREAVRAVWMDFCEQAARRCMSARERLPPEQQLDVYYEDMNHDWRGVMRRIYDFAGMEFTAETERALAGALAHTLGERTRRGEHRYSLEDFGTTAAEVDARMSFLRERYAIPYEGLLPARP
jgi:hypothetical protein